MGNYTYYIDDSTNEQIFDKWDNNTKPMNYKTCPKQTNLKNYSINELSNIVFNKEILYNLAVKENNLRKLKKLLDYYYIYTAKQYKQLIHDIEHFNGHSSENIKEL